MRISLTSIGYKIISTLLLLFLLTLDIVFIINASQIPWYAFAFVNVIILFVLFALILCFTNAIIIDDNKKIIKIINLRKKIIQLSRLKQIYISSENSLSKLKYCKIVFELKSNERIVLPGFISLWKSKDVRKTEVIVEKINDYIQTFDEG